MKMKLLFVMVNLFGVFGYIGLVYYKYLEECFKIEGVYFYFYGKSMIKLFCKMGYVIIVDELLECVVGKVCWI